MHQPVANQPSAANEKFYGQSAPPATVSGTVYRSPTWVSVVRGVQLLCALIVAGLSGWLIHGYLANEIAFALVCGIFTWIICIYALVSEMVTDANHLYNVYAILGLDTLMAIFWLASMGAVANFRTGFTVPVTVQGCWSDGSAVDSRTCVVARDLEKRAPVAGRGALAMISAIAGVSALELILFVATFVWLFLEWRKSRPAGLTPSAVEMNTGMQNGGGASIPQYQQQMPPMQPQYSGQPPMPQQQQQTFVPSPASGHSATPVQPQFTGQQQQPSPHYGQQPIPYQQIPTPGPEGTYNGAQQQQQPVQQMTYSPSVSPAPQQAQYQPYNAQQMPNQQYPQQYPPQK